VPRRGAAIMSTVKQCGAHLMELNLFDIKRIVPAVRVSVKIFFWGLRCDPRSRALSRRMDRLRS
jgi:hypothetical protein